MKTPWGNLPREFGSADADLENMLAGVDERWRRQGYMGKLQACNLEGCPSLSAVFLWEMWRRGASSWFLGVMCESPEWM